MQPEKVDEHTAACSASTFSTLLRRKRPLRLCGAARRWLGRDFLKAPGVKDLTTTWRVHPRGGTTVWEAECQFVDASIGQFLEWEMSTAPLSDNRSPFASFDRSTHWAYADYKHVKELAEEWSRILELIIDWSSLGFEKTATDSTVWLGTEESHTPLHHDTYGVNLVAQLLGRKKWLLYPPKDTPSLYPTRVPYEESSVFSLVDARKPDWSRFPRFAEVRPLSVTLEPGDVLYVPKHWWHYVEALDTSLSVNVWVDAPDDSDDRAREALARVLVTSLARGLESEVGPGWLNPTEEGVWPLDEALQVADIAFQSFEATGGGGGLFSVRALVDAVTAPDILRKVTERILQRGKAGPSVRIALPSDS